MDELAEGRYEGDSGTDTKSLKESVAATFLKLDRFNERLTSIRHQLADRQRVSLQPRPLFDPLKHNNYGEAAAETKISVSVDDQLLRLPELPNAAHPPRASEPIIDSSHRLSMGALKTRTDARIEYDVAYERVARAEIDAAAAVQDADRLTEEARIAMVMYSQNEKSWSFDERARRFQNVMQAKKEADGARLKADDERATVHVLRSKLMDPYASLRDQQSSSSSRGRSQTVSYSQLEPLNSDSGSDDTVLVWILASPLLTLPFTPRDATPARVLAAEKELSTHVLYYAAPSTATPYESNKGTQSADDRPPIDGWLSCSSHGVAPAPSVHPVKSSLETRVVSGAGVAHLNGKYVFSGVHNGVAKFKNTSGVELFRKQLPKSSTIVQGLFDAVDTPAPQASTDPQGSSLATQSALPSTLRALEQNDRDFKSMQKIGAWMSANDLNQKRRRLRDTELTEPSQRLDGDHVHKQEASSLRQSASDIAPSRPEATPELCREWVLFLRCSRRVGQLNSDAPPPRDLGLGCLKRHYYISTEEKESMTTWALDQEAWLEKDVLTAILRREALLERIRAYGKKCMSKYQQNLPVETNRLVRKTLLSLNAMRFLTVKVFEVIEAWRAHSRKTGFTRYSGGEQDPTASLTLGWSSCITVETGRQLFKGSKAFVSKYKRFCRPEDPHGQQERRLVYLGYFATRDEAEQAYDAFANAEARRLNTTVQHLPRRRNVFRSCGKHFAVESERLGPDYCIECKAKALGTAGTSDGGGGDDWNPPFYYTPGKNYILQMAHDLDFLDEIYPLKAALNGATDDDRFPLVGNTFLLPKTPLEDPSLAFFSSLHVASRIVPRLRVRSTVDNQEEEENDDELAEVVGESLDVDRVLAAQQAFLQELQIYHPELFQELPSVLASSNQVEDSTKPVRVRDIVRANPERSMRIVQALYWDRCAALRIRQERPPLAFREDGVWCRPDQGEWASFLVRGKHQQHFNFESRLSKAGKETQERRKAVLKTMRKLLRTPLYDIPSRTVIQLVIGEGEAVKGDVVMLEVKAAYKCLAKYDSWCIQSVVVQRWYRGIRGRRRARAWRRALVLSCLGRRQYLEAVHAVASQFVMAEVVPKAIRSTIRTLQVPAYSRAVKMDGEMVVVTVHATGSTPDPLKTPLCTTCIRRFHSSSGYESGSGSFQVGQRVCTCSLNGGSACELEESWLIRAYNPRNNVVYRLGIGSAMLMQLLEAVAGRNPPSASLRPILQAKEMSQAVVVATNMANHIESLAAEAQDEAMNWQLTSDEAMQRRKTAEVELERARARVESLTERFRIAIDDARGALDFASRPFHQAQAWDPLENANDWRFLVDKRHTEKQLNTAIEDADRCRVEVFQSISSERFLRVQAKEARDYYESHWRVLRDRHRAQVRRLAVELETHQASLGQIFDRICTSQLALRDTFMAPTRRALVVAPTVWLRTDAGMQRMQKIAIPGLVRGRNVIRRRILHLSNRGKQPVRQRLVVDVSAWPAESPERRHIWMAAYEPASSTVQRVYLDSELVRLLAPLRFAASVSERSRSLATADHLLSICMLDRFTGAFTLEKLQFYQHLRLLRPQFLSCKWFQDLQRGRKCGDGDEIFRQAASIDGRLCSVVVFENWGDLVVLAYQARTARTTRLRVSIRQVFEALAPSPLALHLWICCVKSNQYVPSIVTTLLKFVRFRTEEDGVDRLQWVTTGEEGTPTNRVSIAATVDGRRMLLTFRDTHSGDLDIRGLVMGTSQPYRLRLEWDTIRVALKRSHSTDPPTRRKNLLLTRNRQELCTWLASRLRFQSLLAHPDSLAKLSSPLVSGIQIRQSVALFNDWISSSARNPLATVPKNEVERYAAQADSLLFGGLVYEQLAFVPGDPLPVSDSKKWLETRDFLMTGPKTRADHLKIDYYAQAHRLFARVRREIEAERRSRLEREERDAMEREEVHGLRFEITSELETAGHAIDQCRATLQSIDSVLVARIAAWTMVFEEMTQRDSQKADPPEDSADAVSTKKKKKKRTKQLDRDSQGHSDFDASRVVVQLLRCGLQGSDIIYHVVYSARMAMGGTLPVLQSQLKVVTEAVGSVSQRFEAFKIKTSASLEATLTAQCLISLRAQTLRFSRAFDTADLHSTDAVVELPSQEEEDPMPRIATSSHSLEVYQTPEQPVHSAVVIPPHGAIEEVAIDSSLAVHRSFADVAGQAHEFTRLFRRPVSSKRERTPLQLVSKRTRLGVVVFQRPLATESSSVLQWNPLASALAMEPAVGVAVFIPTTQDQRSILHQARSMHQALVDSVPIVERPARPRSSSPSITAVRRVTVQRSKQLLLWKQFSIERMQTTRKLRQQRAIAALLLRKVDADKEREAATLAMIILDSHQLEWLTGSPSPTSDALTTVGNSLRLTTHRQISGASTSSLVLHNEQCLHDLFPGDELRQRISSSLDTETALELGHIRVEIDDWRRPRRLLFSARELQSQQQYVVDASFAQLASFNVAKPQLHWPSVPLAVQDWRDLAKMAARHLVFTRKNGTLSLSLQSTAVPVSMDESPTQDATVLTAPSVRSSGVRYRQQQVVEAIFRCRSRRFAKHQRAIRLMTVARASEALRRDVEDRRLGFEWLRMTKEDWLAQEHRGVLTLDDKVLKKLKKAYAHAHQRHHSDRRMTTAETMQPLTQEIKKEMGIKEAVKKEPTIVSEEEEDEAFAFVKRMRAKTMWWADKHPDDEPGFVDLADVAEWWRQRSVASRVAASTQ